MLAATALVKRYHTFREIEAVSGVDVRLQAGQMLALVGRSGSGKSTLLAMLGGLLRPTGGSVIVDDIDLWALDGDALAQFRNRHTGFVFQLPSVLPTLRAVDNVALPALIGRVVAPPVAYGRAEQLLRTVGLSERIEAYPAELSGGEQRRVAIARALINSPPLILADEPTADLDAHTESEILDLLFGLQRREGFTMVVVTHNDAVARMADVMIEMSHGRVTSTSAGSLRTTELPPLTRHHVAAAVVAPAAVAPAPAEASVRLGKGFDRLLTAIGFWVAPAVIIMVLINAVVAGYQQHVLNKQRAAALALEELAMSGLRADVKSIAFGAGESYEADLYVRNVSGGTPIFMMSPAVRAFVQVGARWQEVPLRPLDGGNGGVLQLTGERVLRYVLEPGVLNYEELIPHYMHVRFSNTMLVSRDEHPQTPADIVERSDDYYVYLKPRQADDAAILRELKFDGTPPIWIPMPPH